MAIDYNAMAKKASQAVEKASVSFDEGQTLVYLVPFERGVPQGMPCVTVDVWGGEVNDKFKRSVIGRYQPLTEDDQFLQVASLPDGDPIGDWAAENLSAEELRKAKPKTMRLYVVVTLAHRRKKSQGWVDIYTKPQWASFKDGGAKNPHLQLLLSRIIDEDPSVTPRLFDPDAAQLLIVNRTGKGRYDTVFGMELATEEGLDCHVLSEEIRADIAEATAPGAYCDLLSVVAESFCPDEEEVQKRLYGVEPNSEKPGMQEA